MATVIFKALGVLFWGLAWGAILTLFALLILTGLYKDPCDADGVAVHSIACDALNEVRR